MTRLFPALAALSVMALIYALNLTQPLGAHPFWSQKVVLIGAPLGLFAGYAASRLSGRAFWLLSGFVMLAMFSYAIAHFGKARFAASYAEDALAGKLWYFGWIATSGAVTATVMAATQSLWPPR